MPFIVGFMAKHAYYLAHDEFHNVGLINIISTWYVFPVNINFFIIVWIQRGDRFNIGGIIWSSFHVIANNIYRIKDEPNLLPNF